MSSKRWEHTPSRWLTAARYQIKAGKGDLTGIFFVYRLVYGRRGPLVDTMWAGITWQGALDLVDQNIRLDRRIQAGEGSR